MGELGATSVVSLGTRADALQWLASNRPDLAIVDPRVNDGVCTDVVEFLSRNDVPFVIYSGASVEEDASKAFSRGAWLKKPTMPKPGRAIINSMSIQSRQPSPQLLAYASTKGAVSNFTAGLAEMLAKKGHSG